MSDPQEINIGEISRGEFDRLMAQARKAAVTDAVLSWLERNRLERFLEGLREYVARRRQKEGGW